MTQEFDLHQDNGHIEDKKPTDYEKKVQLLKEEVMKHMPDSPTFQAFADFADSVSRHNDFMTVQEQDLGSNHLALAGMEYTLVNETIRQRKNEPAGFRGYKDAFIFFQSKGLELSDISPRELDEKRSRKLLASSLQKIKDDTIKAKNYGAGNKSTETH